MHLAAVSCRSGQSLSDGHIVKRLVILVSLAAIANATAVAQEIEADTRPSIAPDIRDDETNLKLQRGDFVIVPIPISNPTLDTGLVLGGAYFYAQTEEQKKAQPASVTGAGGLYTSNDSRALVLVQQNYWNRNKWRFTGAIGAADLRLSLLAPDDTSSGQSVNWRIDGEFLYAKLSAKIAGNWYGGLFTRYVNANQSIETDTSTANLDTAGNIRAVGIGALVEFDSRDMPMNTYGGRYFKADVLANDEAIGSDQTYQSYSLAFRSYHELTDTLVLAWELEGCNRAGRVPLWDACRIGLRGFAATDYLGKASASWQAEARWRMSKRWGVVGFGGAGFVGSSFSGVRDNEAIPSFGVGLRFMVLQAKRVNLRLDFAWSKDSDAIHFSVGEAF